MATDFRKTIDEILGVKASPQQKARDTKGGIPIVGNPQLKRTPKRRLFFDTLRSRSAIDTLRGLPADGETWHCIMSGSYDGFDLIDAILAHASPSVIQDLHLASLGFNHVNATRLLKLIDSSAVRRCTMIVSVYYEAGYNEQATCYQLATELPACGGWYLATLCHAKVVCARMSDGRCFVIESSANLRSCSSIEQFTITQDVGLFEFHKQWMESAREIEKERLAKRQPRGR